MPFSRPGEKPGPDHASLSLAVSGHDRLSGALATTTFVAAFSHVLARCQPVQEGTPLDPPGNDVDDERPAG